MFPVAVILLQVMFGKLTGVGDGVVVSCTITIAGCKAGC